MKRLKILLVDDEPETGIALRGWLDRSGHDATYVMDPQAADHAIAGEVFDLILSDIQMRGNSRLEWIERLFRNNCPPPILLMTGDPQLETAMRAANLPVAGYLLKPLDYTTTAAMIDQLGAQQAERREAIAAIAEISALLAEDGSRGKPLDSLSQQLKTVAETLTELIRPIRQLAQPERRLPWQDAIADAITVLEKTKQSFRSRELGALRQRLLRLMPETSFPCSRNERAAIAAN